MVASVVWVGTSLVNSVAFAASSAIVSPASLLHRLAATPYRLRQLPSGYATCSAVVGARPPGAPRGYRPAGSAGVMASGPVRGLADIYYVVYPENADARGAATHLAAVPKLHLIAHDAAPFRSLPGTTLLGSSTGSDGKAVTDTLEALALRNVVVTVVTAAPSTIHSDTTAVLRSAVRHLKEVENETAGPTGPPVGPGYC
jgi:hypothetical protein